MVICKITTIEQSLNIISDLVEELSRVTATIDSLVLVGAVKPQAKEVLSAVANAIPQHLEQIFTFHSNAPTDTAN